MGPPYEAGVRDTSELTLGRFVAWAQDIEDKLGSSLLEAETALEAAMDPTGLPSGISSIDVAHARLILNLHEHCESPRFDALRRTVIRTTLRKANVPTDLGGDSRG